MLQLDRHLRHLLRRHDCVAVPGLGAFLASYVPARYDAGHESYMPPTRTLGFNAEVAHNDGLLVASVARAEGIAYESAALMVDRAVEAVNAGLAGCGEWAFERVGVLRRNEAGALEFEPARNCAAADAYALLPVVEHLPLLARSGSAADEAEAGEFPAKEPRRGSRVLRVALRVAASVAIVGGLAWTAIGLAPTLGDASRDTAALAPAPRMEEPKGRAADLLTGNLSDTRELYIAIPAPEPESEQPVASPSAAAASETDAWCLVVASLPSRSLAEKHIRSVGDPSLRILESEGRFRVYAATGPTYQATLARKADIQQGGRYADAWVCRMR